MTPVALMEWRKLTSIRSTAIIAALFAASMIGFAALVAVTGPAHPGGDYDPTSSLLTGLAVGQLLIGVLGALTLSSEFGTGSIRATFAAVPRRGRVLAAKAAVLAAVSLVLGEALVFAAFAAYHLAAKHGEPVSGLGQPGVLRALLLGGAYPALIGLIGLGLAAVIRHTAGTIAAVVGVVFVLPLLLLPLGQHNSVLKFLPEMIAENSLAAVKPVVNSLSAGAGFGLLCLYAAVALAAGGWALARRDA